MTTIPTSGTNIRLLSGIPFTSDYKHTRWHDTLSAQTNYFTGKPIVAQLTDSSFQRIEGEKGRYVKVNQGIDKLWKANYIMFQNTDYNGKWFYGFITNLEYKNDGLTHVHFEIDVLQTWMFDINFKPSYILREHCNLWNADGTPVINTIDEQLNYGSEYEVVSVDHWIPYEDVFFLVIVTKTPVHTGTTNVPYPTRNGVPQPLSYYVHPFKLNGSYPNVDVNGSNLMISSILDVLATIFLDSSSVNNVVSLYITEHIGASMVDITYSGGVMSFSGSFEGVQVSDGTNSFNTIYLKDMISYSTLQKTIRSSKYDGFKTVSESKLMMYPYCLTLIDDFKGNRKIIKNEYIEDSNLSLRTMGSLGTSNKVAYMVDKYLQDNDSTDVQQLTQMLQLENALINNNPNDLPIMSDYLSAFLQGNKNQIANQRSTIQWDGTMGVISSGIGAVASAAMMNPIGVASSIGSAAKTTGDSLLKLNAINAKIQDISNVPPSLSKMGSNSQFDFGNGYTGVYVIKKQITDEYIRKLTDYFNMFGYKVNEVKTPNLHTRQNWNFVQTESCIITGDMNNQDLQAIRNIFDNGITLWHTDSIGSYDLANGVI